MKSPHRCNCDECMSIDMVLQELDRVTPVRIARARKIMSVVVG